MEREGARGERDDSYSTSVEHQGRERERKEESAILMMSFSPWEEEETYAASRGTQAGLSMHTLAALFFQTHTHTVTQSQACTQS